MDIDILVKMAEDIQYMYGRAVLGGGGWIFF